MTKTFTPRNPLRRIPSSLALLLFALPAFSAPAPLETDARGAPPADFVTGGGWIAGTPSGERANFGLNGGVDEVGSFFGHVNLVDHGDDLHFKSTSVTNYGIVDDVTRQLEGMGVLDDGTTVDFQVTLTDEGEPGSADTFEITLSSGYSASGTLQGGNIQIHAS